MLDLPTVTLLAVDTADPALALRALQRSASAIRFARVLLLTANEPSDCAIDEGVEVRPIRPIALGQSYSDFVLRQLTDHVETPHALLVRWDGYVVNPDAWDPRFLNCDYISAKSSRQSDGLRVANGVFSLISRKLLRDAGLPSTEAEGVTIGHARRAMLERKHGIVFADEALADRFAFDLAYPSGGPFGFQGLHNFCRAMPQEELVAVAESFTDSIAGSPQLAQLLRNCIALAQWNAAIALARRRLAVQLDDGETRALLAQAEAAVARGPVVSRNDPCPCGSGKRYKACHGAIENGPEAAIKEPRPAPLRMTIAQRLQAAVSAHQRGELATAEEHYRRVLDADPSNVMANHYLGVLAYQRNRPEEALPLVESSTRQIPKEPEFRNNLGLVLTALDRYDDAIAAFEQTLTLKPGHAAAWSNMGLALLANGDSAAAVAAYRKAIALAPDYAQARWNLALALLRSGHYAEGWREYEARLAIPEFRRHGAPLSTPRWHGETITGKTVLITREQGLGDTLQFIRFVAPLSARGARVVVETPEPLVHLVTTAPGVASSFVEGEPIPSHDVHTPLLSLPHLLGIGGDRIGMTSSYLLPDWKRRAQARDYLASVSDGALRVGLAWSGAPGNPLNRRRSCPLEALAPLLQTPGIAWFSLQKGEAEHDVTMVPAAEHLRLTSMSQTFDSTAALVAELDLIVSVDTSIVHLAGALGRPVWLMLAYASDWRWGADDTTPWYPSARLFRQQHPRDWTSVVERIASELHSRLQT